MAQTTQRVVVELAPSTARLLDDIATSQGITKRAAVELGILRYAKVLGLDGAHPTTGGSKK